jgi:NAD(P)-dependent dehydrogenase (short-subunit alcohol dehydrogenase family)
LHFDLNFVLVVSTGLIYLTLRYSFTKQCNIWFAQYLAQEFAARNINVLAVSAEPGWAATGMKRKM